MSFCLYAEHKQRNEKEELLQLDRYTLIYNRIVHPEEEHSLLIGPEIVL